MTVTFIEGERPQIIGIYPMAAAFYTAYQMGGGEKGFPFPTDLDEKEKGRFAQARRHVCKAIAAGERIDQDGGDLDRHPLRAPGAGAAPGPGPGPGPSAWQRPAFHRRRAQLDSFYEILGVPAEF